MPTYKLCCLFSIVKKKREVCSHIQANMDTTITSNLKQISGPVLIGTNYEFWSIKMKTFLQLNKCWDMAETKFKEPDTNALEKMNNAQKNSLEAR